MFLQQSPAPDKEISFPQLQGSLLKDQQSTNIQLQPVSLACSKPSNSAPKIHHCGPFQSHPMTSAGTQNSLHVPNTLLPVVFSRSNHSQPTMPWASSADSAELQLLRQKLPIHRPNSPTLTKSSAISTQRRKNTLQRSPNTSTASIFRHCDGILASFSSRDRATAGIASNCHQGFLHPLFGLHFLGKWLKIEFQLH